MIKPNTYLGNQQLLAVQNSSSNTRLDIHLPLTLATNSFKSSLPLQLDSQFNSLINHLHIDFLRISSSDLTYKSFTHLTTVLFGQIEHREIDEPWHPHPETPKSKQYQQRIEAKAGIILGFTKRAKYKGINKRYVYDIMIDFRGGYFADLTLLEQQKFISWLNSHWEVKCHRIDVAIDDYSKKLFPVLEIIQAVLDGNHYGFKLIDDEYLQIYDDRFEGTLGLCSRESNLFIRIYTKDGILIRYEAELKYTKARRLFKELVKIADKDISEIVRAKEFLEALAKAALDDIDFRANDNPNGSKNRAKSRTKRLPFWTRCRDRIQASIDNVTDTNHLVYHSWFFAVLATSKAS